MKLTQILILSAEPLMFLLSIIASLLVIIGIFINGTSIVKCGIYTEDEIDSSLICTNSTNILQQLYICCGNSSIWYGANGGMLIASLVILFSQLIIGCVWVIYLYKYKNNNNLP